LHGRTEEEVALPAKWSYDNGQRRN
jgi:hypothetical protein